MNRTLVIFTDYFPYGTTETFLESEIGYCAAVFERVIICPRKITDTKRDLPGNTELSHIFAGLGLSNRYKLYLRGLVFIITYLRLLQRLAYFKYFSIPGYLKAIKYSGLAASIKKRISALLHVNKFDPEHTLFYTYWLGYETFALGLLKLETYGLKNISRVHRYDLYDEQGGKSLAFIKSINLQLVDRIFCISSHGQNYLMKHYQTPPEKLVLSYLGTQNQGFTITHNNTGIFRIASCSAIREVKRLDKIIDVLAELGKLGNTKNIEWHHLGDGPLKYDIELLAGKKIDPGLKYIFHGQLSNTGIFGFYQDYIPSILINLSDSEGLPVSIMEAMSVGIPVMATDTGGVSEIVNDENGWLIAPSATASEIAAMLNEIIANPQEINRKGDNAHKHWNLLFNANINYTQFVQQLLNI